MHALKAEQKKELIRSAFLAQKRAYTPYSGFQVGAALLTRDGKIYEGCNIENASFGATNCAERTAFFRAVYEGERDFLAIAIVGKPERAQEFQYCAPCGICRQVMAEFCSPKEFQILLPRSEEDYKEYTLEELLPLSFTEDSMK
ncbi:MAG TPA: cytidine deaminase [Candidatus Blautia faecigallinarum]|uniref:Cytidine deaminase n=1 Tax=Candidatus Blautia faecigallinarum TaxID=2838488 RepID=A0A9D2DRI9_9FIRM|nr:cytidine deaminase [Candidatus Blautia faecigallinarum]